MANIKDLEELLRRAQEARKMVGPVGGIGVGDTIEAASKVLPEAAGLVGRVAGGAALAVPALLQSDPVGEGSDIVPGSEVIPSNENLKDGEDRQSSDYTNQVFNNMNKDVPNPDIINNVPEYAPYGKIKDTANSNYPDINNENLIPKSEQKLKEEIKKEKILEAASYSPMITGTPPESQQPMLKDLGIPSSMDMKTENTNSLLHPDVHPDTPVLNRSPLLTDVERSFNEYKRLKGDNSNLRDAALADAFTGFGQDYAKYSALAGNAAAMSASGKSINPQMLKFEDPKLLARAQKEYDNSIKTKAKEISDLRKLEKTKGLTTYQLTQIKLRQQELANKSTRENRIQNDQLLRRKRVNNKDIYGVVKDFENDNVVKELKKQNISFGQAESLLTSMENDNRVALGALGTKLARAMGEVGVLTDADVVRYINRYDVSGKVLDYFSGKISGKLSDVTEKDLRDIVQIFKFGSQKNIKTVRKKYISYAYNNFGKDTGYSMDEVNKRFGISNVPKPKEQRRTTKDGKIAIFDSKTKKFLRYE